MKNERLSSDLFVTPRQMQDSTERRRIVHPSSTDGSFGRLSNQAEAWGGRQSELSIEYLRLFTLNISGPSIRRAGELLLFLAELDPDVLVLTETRANAGTKYLLDSYRASGYSVSSPMPELGGERGVAVIHRFSADHSSLDLHVDLPHRVLASTLQLTEPLTLVGAYVPSRDTSPIKIERKRNFLCQLAQALRKATTDQNVIFLGDLNVVHRSHLPRYSSFRSWEYEFLEEVAECGLVDAFAELHPDVQAHSWIGRTGDGYRYDYGFVSEALRSQLVECEYLNDPRHLAISDHRGVLMTITADGERTAACLASCVQDRLIETG